MEPITTALTAAGASAIGDIAGTAFSGIFGRSNMKKQASMTSGLMAQQFAYDKEKMQNAWQWTMNDLKKAGLNPTLMFGGGGSATVAGGSAGSAGGTTYPNGNLLSGLSALKEIGLMDAQKKNIEADTKNKEQQFELTPQITKAAIELNNTQSALNRAQKAKTLEEEINTNLRNHAQEIANRNADLDYNKRKQVYDKEIAEYIGQLSLKLRELGLKDNDIYTVINGAFETAGKLFRVVNVSGGSTNTTYKTTSINSPIVNY